jgi:hypothetical protein
MESFRWLETRLGCCRRAERRFGADGVRENTAREVAPIPISSSSLCLQAPSLFKLPLSSNSLSLQTPSRFDPRPPSPPRAGGSSVSPRVTQRL